MNPPAPSRLIAAIIISSLILLLSVVTGLSYSSASVECARCHTAQESVVSSGVHASVSCERCHAPSSAQGKLRFGSAVLFGMRTQLVEVSGTDAIAVPNSRCTACHDMSKSGAVGSAVRIDHQACAAGDTCVRCHDAVVHGSNQQLITAIDMFECLECHTKEAQTLECDACHRGRLPRDRVKTGTFAVTHGRDWERNHGMGSITACTACHTPDDCSECHGTGVPHGLYFATQHGARAASKQAKCESCHREDYCDSCHGLQMPHPKGFKEQHSTLIAAKGDDACKRCHAESDCTNCHIMHIHPGGAIRDGSE